MPGISGGDLGSRLTELYPTLPVLYTSGFADDDVIRRGLLDATRPFLQKPFTPAELGLRVREVLDSPAAREHRVPEHITPVEPDDLDALHVRWAIP